MDRIRLRFIVCVVLLAGVRASFAGPNPMLHVADSRLVNQENKPMVLRGVNLGGWLLWEGWIFGGGFTSETDILNRLTKLVGFDAMQAFRAGVHSNFVTADDFRKIADLGFNCVRLPVNYRLLDDGAHQFVYREAGWRLLDQALDWCDQYHLYAVIDLHSVPGGQTRLFTADRDEGGQLLWDSSAAQRQTVALWRAVAARYKTRTCVAGYDLINEPNPPKGEQLVAIYRQLIDAIRAEDKQHLLILEGSRLATDFSMFQQPPDSNMAYSFHIYTWFGDNRRQLLAEYAALAKQQGLPLWVGEFGENNYEMIGTTVRMFEAQPEICGWAFWPWKKAETKNPGLVTIKVSADWQDVMAWVAQPFLHRKPDTEEAKRAMQAFLEAAKLQNAALNQQMVKELLSKRP